MDDINVRISECIKSMNIKKTEFAARINVSQAFVSQLTNGTSRPSDRTISDICREFGVNEIWLRTGVGVLEAMAELPREAQRYILGVAQGMAMKAEMQQ